MATYRTSLVIISLLLALVALTGVFCSSNPAEKLLKGYVVIETEILDAEAYSEYIEKIVSVSDAHGARFVVRTSEIEPFEGGWAPKRFIVMEFDNLKVARAFLYSPEYHSLEGLRQKAVRSKIVIVEGVDP